MTISCIPNIVDTINFSAVDGFLIDHVDRRQSGKFEGPEGPADLENYFLATGRNGGLLS